MVEFFSMIHDWLAVVSGFLNHMSSVVQVTWQQMNILYAGMSLNFFPFIISAGIGIVLFVGAVKFVLGR